MSAESQKAEEDKTEARQDLSATDLQDLEQHISQRISKLTDLTGQVDDTLYQLDPDQLARTDTSMVPPFESYENLDMPSLHATEEGLRAAYQDLSTSINRNAEVLQSIHDLNDLLTDSIRQLSIRMASIEERVVALSETAEHEFKRHGKELRTLAKETAARPAREGAGDGKTGTDATAGILAGLQKEVIELGNRIDRFGSDLKRELDQRSSAAREQLDARLKTTGGMPEETREHLNRVIFNLAVLLIIVAFVAGVLVVNTLDRMTTFMTESIDSLRASVDQLTILENSPRSGETGR